MVLLHCFYLLFFHRRFWGWTLSFRISWILPHFPSILLLQGGRFSFWESQAPVELQALRRPARNQIHASSTHQHILYSSFAFWQRISRKMSTSQAQLGEEPEVGRPVHILFLNLPCSPPFFLLLFLSLCFGERCDKLWFLLLSLWMDEQKGGSSCVQQISSDLLSCFQMHFMES